MNTKRILLSVVTGVMLTGSLAMAAQRNDQPRSKTRVKATKPTATTTMTTGGNRAVRTGTVSNPSTVFVGGSSFGFGYPYYSYGYGYPYYSYGYYPYDYYGSYPYNYGYYYYNQPGYDTYANGSVVIQVQSRLARAGYYHGPIDGVMGPRTHYAIQAYERDHGLRVDGVISGQLLRTVGLRY